ncbi:MAG TPA: carboxyl transferase domain-containing protein [Usitatibacter sp.]|nr:carboxyl transferase domain-containing protein [Usitatibacter sp.]
MTAAPQPDLRTALVAALSLQDVGQSAGNVTIARGTLGGRAVHAALVDSRFASGAIGSREAERLGALFRVAAIERSPVVLFLDSAGAKVSEGLAALGAFRQLFRAGLDAAFSGAPMAALLGRNCFGGSSMLAHLAAHRLFSPATRLGMSGPAVIAAAGQMDPLDEMFRAMAEAAMSPAARTKASPANEAWAPGSDLSAWLAAALAPVAEPAAAFLARHAALAERLGPPAAAPSPEPVRRRDLERIYPEGYEARESAGFLEGCGRGAAGEEPFLGIVGGTPLAAARAWRFADAAWRERGPGTLRVFLDCASHATRLDEEKLVLSEYVVDMSVALAAAARRGRDVHLTILGKAGGGVYVALAAPAGRVSSVHGADIQVLPGSAVAAILGESREALPSFDNYRAARVADEELRLGLAP